MGEGVTVSGNIIASSDVRIDMWSKLESGVEVGKNAYLGEFVTIDGKLIVEGDLDVGKEVKIKGGFEAKGWILVRNPVPVIIFIFLYIREMMRLGKGEEIEKAIEELFDDSEDSQVFERKESGEKILFIPADAKVSPENIDVSGETVIGNNCLLIGNIRTQAFEAGKNLTLKGGVYSESKISIGDDSTIYGNLSSKGQVQIGRNSRIFGGVKADSVLMYESARVDGTIKAPSGVSFLREAVAEMPVLADVNALGKVIFNKPSASSKGESQNELIKALGLNEVESTVNTNVKAKNGFVPGRSRKTARTQALERTRRFTGSRIYRKEQRSGERSV